MKGAADSEELSKVGNSDLAIQVFKRCGIGQSLSVSTKSLYHDILTTIFVVLQVSAKHVIGHEIIAFDARTNLVVACNPQLFLPLFVRIPPDEVLEALFIKQDLSVGEQGTLKNLVSASGDLCSNTFFWLCEVSTPQDHSLQCDCSLMLPSKVFTQEVDFPNLAAAVVGCSDTFNMV